MYECPNCAGNLKFDILAQKLHCDFCGTLVDPYDISKERDAEEHTDEYEVTIFSCPQCGGEILSEDTTAATFCSFCGSATILDNRVSKERRPAHIIPFTKTKEDCKKSYAKMIKRAIYAPNELKDPEHIKKFRGIYMPYAVYNFEKNGPTEFGGSTSKQWGDYLYTDYYKLRCDVEQSYQGLTFDVSSSFADNLSEAIAPYDLREAKEFTPTFLSGFYADTSDVDPQVYEPDAEMIVVEDCAEQLRRNPECKKYKIDSLGLVEAVRPTKKAAALAMLPVWFLAYRNGDRVSYTVVNGQTGKGAADIPVDLKKYLFGSILTTLPVFILLNLLFTFKPNKLLIIALFLAVLCIGIANSQLSRLLAREFGEDDKGVMSRKFSSEAFKEDMSRRYLGVANKMSDKSGKIAVAVVTGFILLRYGLPLGPLIVTIYNVMSGPVKIGVGAFLALFIYVAIVNSPSMKKKCRARPGDWKRKLPILIKPMTGAVLALIILLVNPVSDWIYYVSTIFCMGTLLWSIKDIFVHHNELATRKLPQFNTRGGEEYE